MKIFITGGTGFIGSHLANSLIADGHHVIVTGSKAENEVKNAICLDCHFNGIDIDRLGNIDVCFHLGANNDTLDTDRREMFRANVDAPKEMFEKLLDKHNCKKFIYASSASVYGNGQVPLSENNQPNPLSVYAESKLKFDEWILDSGFPALGLRYTNVYGNNEKHKGRRASMISKMIECVKNNKPLKLFKYGEQKRDWIFVKDVVNMNKLAMNIDEIGIINCGSGYVATFNELANFIMAELKTKQNIEYIDCNIDFQNNTTICLKKARSLGFIPQYNIATGISILCSSTS